MVENEVDAENLLVFLISQHDNIKITMEKQTDNKLPFLDAECEIDKGKFITNLYKNGLVRTLIDRIFCINSTWKGFDHDINKLKLT